MQGLGHTYLQILPRTHSLQTTSSPPVTYTLLIIFCFCMQATDSPFSLQLHCMAKQMQHIGSYCPDSVLKMSLLILYSNKRQKKPTYVGCHPVHTDWKSLYTLPVHPPIGNLTTRFTKTSCPLSSNTNSIQDKVLVPAQVWDSHIAGQQRPRGQKSEKPSLPILGFPLPPGSAPPPHTHTFWGSPAQGSTYLCRLHLFQENRQGVRQQVNASLPGPLRTDGAGRKK